MVKVDLYYVHDLTDPKNLEQDTLSSRMTRYPDFITVLIGIIMLVTSLVLFTLYPMKTAYLTSMLTGVGKSRE